MSETKCVNIKKNKEYCPCASVECERYGICCDCVRSSLDEVVLPSCMSTKIKNDKQFRENVMKVIDQAVE